MISISKIQILILHIAFLFPLTGTAFCHIWSVTNTALEGTGSLAWAIQQSQERSGADTVQFAIPLSDTGYQPTRGTWEINLRKPFVDFTDDSTFIDGASQSRNIGEANPDGLEIVLLGWFPYPGEVPPFKICSAYNKIAGLTISRFRSEHIHIVGADAHDNVIQNCYIGMDADGMVGYPNKWNTGIHIREGAHHNLIGSRNAGERNILGSFWYEAIEFVHGAHHNRVIGNYIGVDKTGTGLIGVGWNRYQSTPFIKPVPIDSLYSAIYIRMGSYANEIGGALPGEGNVICGAGRSAIEVKNRYSDDTVIRGNYIGVGADGETAIPNNEYGIIIYLVTEAVGPLNTIIGGTAPGAGNVISGNRNHGIFVYGNSQNTLIQGNRIGTNAAATKLIANGQNGILFGTGSYRGFPNHNVIGPGNIIIASAADAENNLIAGIKFEGSGTSDNTITGNHIGCNKTGSISTAFNSGIILRNGAHHNMIGPDNVIAKNKKHGVYIHSNGAVANTITRNSIYGNSQKAIALEAGANEDLPAPNILSVQSGSVTGLALPNSRIELFADDLDQARLFLGSVMTDADGHFQWSGEMQLTSVTATVTDAAGNTSELAASRPLLVELMSFDVHLEESRIRLQWTTTAESNNLGFHVERKLPGGQFEVIGFVTGAGTSSATQNYYFHDVLHKVPWVIYRLLQEDFDGTLVCSHEVKLLLMQPLQFTLSPAWPNPFNGFTTLSFTVPQSARVNILVCNLRGEQVRMLTREQFPPGEHQVQWDGRDNMNRQVSSGVYFIRMIFNQGELLFSKVLYLR